MKKKRAKVINNKANCFVHRMSKTYNKEFKTEEN